MESQCLGLAEALGLSPVIKRVALRAPWRWLSPVPLSWAAPVAISPAGDPVAPPWPDLLIASGRRSVIPSLLVGNGSFRVQLQDPGIDPARFDLVIVPAHDRLRGPNVIALPGAMHRASAAKLAAARAHFTRLEALPRPRVAVILGGANDVFRFDATVAADLAARVKEAVRAAGGSAMVTASRRTGPEGEAILRRELADLPGEFWDGTTENPYFGYLAYADAIVVTGDSVNMVTEAAATGRPVHVAALPGGSAKFDRFHQAMREIGYTRPFTGGLEAWDYTPPDDMERVAAALRERLAARGISLAGIRLEAS